MAQHDYVIANASGASVRADINGMALAISSNNSGSSTPSTTYAYEFWADTSANVLKIRNGANNAWITLPFSITANNTVDINGGAIDGTNIGASSAGTGAFTTLSASGALTGTLATAAQTNVTSLGTLTALTGGTGDFNWDSGTLFVDSSANIVGIGTATPTDPQGFGTALHIEGATNSVLYLRDTGNNNYGYLGFAGGSDNRTTLTSVGSGYIQLATNNTERMRILADGKVGIGETAPLAPLHITTASQGTLPTLNGDADNLLIEDATCGITLMSAANGGGMLAFGDVNDADVGRIFYYHVDNTMSFRTAGVEAMRILANGNVSIGATDGVDPFTVIGSTVTNLDIGADNDACVIATFANDTSNRSGRLKICGTNQNENNSVALVSNGSSNVGMSLHTAGGGTVKMALNIGSDQAIQAPLLNTTGSTTNRYPLYWVHTGTVGNLEPYTGSIRAMKKDIADMSSVNWIHSLTPRSFKFRDYTQAEDGTRTYLETTNDLPNTEYGLIADEVDAVSGSDYILDKDDDDNLKGVLYHNLVPVLLKAVQELKTELDAAKARITTLEG